jgi:hypothetical protein
MLSTFSNNVLANPKFKLNNELLANLLPNNKESPNKMSSSVLVNPKCSNVLASPSKTKLKLNALVNPKFKIKFSKELLVNHRRRISNRDSVNKIKSAQLLRRKTLQQNQLSFLDPPKRNGQHDKALPLNHFFLTPHRGW